MYLALEGGGGEQLRLGLGRVLEDGYRRGPGIVLRGVGGVSSSPRQREQARRLTDFWNRPRKSTATFFFSLSPLRMVSMAASTLGAAKVSWGPFDAMMMDVIK
jgi:hypothetical protein